MNLPETKNGVFLEIASWEKIIGSSDWRVFRKLVEEHVSYLQYEVNGHLRKHDDRKAGEALRAMDDGNKILSLVTSRLNQLRNQPKEE